MYFLLTYPSVCPIQANPVLSAFQKIGQVIKFLTKKKRALKMYEFQALPQGKRTNIAGKV